MADLYAAVLEHWSGGPGGLFLALSALFLGTAALYCALAQKRVCHGTRGHE